MDMTVAGFIYTYSISNYISGGAYLNDDYMIARYQEYDTVWWRDDSYGSVMDKIGLQKLNNNYRFQDTFPVDYIRHRFWLSKYYSIYRRYPDTLAMGIAKVGGLVAIFKVGFFL